MNITRIIEKVLIVDDDADSNSLCEKIIKKLGFADEIIIKENSQEGINYLKSECEKDQICPSLVLLDLSMHVKDGFDFLEEFEKLPFKENIVIVILTAATNPEDILKLRKAGRYYLILKPMTLDKLLDIYHRYFRNSPR
jgi:CheY-like chemotaxis protein